MRCDPKKCMHMIHTPEWKLLWRQKRLVLRVCAQLTKSSNHLCMEAWISHVSSVVGGPGGVVSESPVTDWLSGADSVREGGIVLSSTPNDGAESVGGAKALVS